MLLLFAANINAAYNRNGGEYFAIIADVDRNDFGWNSLIDSARVDMERNLNISGTLFVPNITTEYDNIKTVDNLIHKSNSFFSSYANSYDDAPIICANKY